MSSVWARLSESASQVSGSISGFFSSLSNATTTPPERTVAFTIGMIALGAKMAKADGEVTDNEVKTFREIFQVPPEDTTGIERIFNLAKQDVAGYETYSRQIAQLFKPSAPVLENVLDGLFAIAMSDGKLHEGELTYLRNVARIFGFEDQAFASILVRHVPSGDEDPYLILGVSRKASPEEIRVQYRQLVKDHHPDLHIAAGMPEEMVILTTDRLAQINAAYDQIGQERGS